MGDIAGVKTVAPTPSVNITITIDISVAHIIAAWTAGQAETVAISGTPLDGQRITMMITNDATARTITFGTGLAATSTLVGTSNKKACVCFLAMGGKYNEVSRATGLAP